MKTYEGMFLADSRKANRDLDAVSEHLNGIMDKCSATVLRLDKWGERKLAYPIAKQTRGVYLLCYFEVADDNETAVTDIYRQVEISDTLLRAMVIRIKEMPELPEVPAVEAAPAAEAKDEPKVEAADEPAEAEETSDEDSAEEDA